MIWAEEEPGARWGGRDVERFARALEVHATRRVRLCGGQRAEKQQLERSRPLAAGVWPEKPGEGW